MAEEQEQYHIVEIAAKIIKNAIKELDSNNNSYPSPDGMKSSGKNVEYLPKSLRIFLDNLFVGKGKSVPVALIGKDIMQQVRPKALIVPLQIGLGIQMHHDFGSKFLIDSLNKHGFCVSYSEIFKYERCAAVHQGTKIPGMSESSSAEPTQAHTLIYAVLDRYLAAKLFECNLGEPSIDRKFTTNSSLQTLKELVKDAHEDISCTMGAHIITTVLNKLLVFLNSTKSKTATLWIQ